MEPRPPGAARGPAGLDNEVVLVNTQDGRHLARSSVAVAPVLGDVVDNQNAAYAYSRCSDCRTVAVAVQVVLVMGNPSTVTPLNLSLAINQDCERCESMASAYQYVLTTDGIVHFSAAGEREITALRDEIAGVTGSDLPFAELDARLDALVDRLWQVVDNELVAAGARFSGAPSKKTSVDTSGDPSPTPSESPDESPSPSPSPAPSRCCRAVARRLSEHDGEGRALGQGRFPSEQSAERRTGSRRPCPFAPTVRTRACRRIGAARPTARPPGEWMGAAGGRRRPVAHATAPPRRRSPARPFSGAGAGAPTGRVRTGRARRARSPGTTAPRPRPPRAPPAPRPTR